MLRPSPLQPCRRAFPCSPPFIPLRNAHSRYVRIHPTGTALLARPGCPTLTGCGSFGRPLSRPFDRLTRSDLGRIEPLPLAWSGDRFRREAVATGLPAKVTFTQE